MAVIAPLPPHSSQPDHRARQPLYTHMHVWTVGGMAPRYWQHSRRLASSLALATWEKAARAPILNLAIGQPAKSLLPAEITHAAANRLAASYDPRHLLQYGSASGSDHYLRAVASVVGVNASTLFATPGNSGALSLISRTLTSPGDVILIEEPTYFLAHQVFKDHCLHFMPAPQRWNGDAGTLDLDELRKILWRSSYLATADNQQVPKLLYCVPTGNNPTGRTMPDAHREHLVALCAEYGVRIVADDVYELLQWDMHSAPRSLRWHAKQQGIAGTVISMGSWSKLLGPGLRLGWLEAEPELLEAFAADGEVASGSLTSPLVESLVASLITSGELQAHVDELRSKLCRRASLLADAINGEQPAGGRALVEAAPAGYFLWVDLNGCDAAALKETCEAQHGVTMLTGTRCSLLPQSAPTHARVCFAFLEEEELVEAGRRLGRAIAEAARARLP